MFRKDIDPMCIYCMYCDEKNDTFTCIKKNKIVEPDDHCRRFKYDPLRRVPLAPATFVSNFEDQDFKI